MEDNEIWIDTRLRKEEMVFLNKAITSEEQRNINEDWKENTAGNVSRCNLIDKDNWFYETVLKKLTEDVYRRYVVDQEKPLPEFEMNPFWVNYMKQYDYVPLHNHDNHSCLFSFVIFMKIPTHWKEQHVTPRKLKSQVDTPKSTSNFQFMWSRQGQSACGATSFPMSSKDEGRMLFFPAWLQHQVYPFYECEEERITISGNIVLKELGEMKSVVDIYEENKTRKRMMENSVEFVKKE